MLLLYPRSSTMKSIQGRKLASHTACRKSLHTYLLQVISKYSLVTLLLNSTFFVPDCSLQRIHISAWRQQSFAVLHLFGPNHRMICPHDPSDISNRWPISKRTLVTASIPQPPQTVSQMKTAQSIQQTTLNFSEYSLLLPCRRIILTLSNYDIASLTSTKASFTLPASPTSCVGS